MNSLLPTTGTNALLEQLSPFIPDDFLIEHWPHTSTGGRQGSFSAAQLWRGTLSAAPRASPARCQLFGVVPPTPPVGPPFPSFPQPSCPACRALSVCSSATLR